MIDKRRLSRLLTACDMAFLQRMTDDLELSAIQTERAPKTSIVMTKVRDSVSNQPFYLGEVLVTECTVSMAGKFGIGVVIGEQPERAYRMAAIDAAVNAGSSILDKWQAELTAEERRIAATRHLECVRSAESKVNFDTMGEYE
ncbi:MAG: phosphonate C-P lyase system protein PhnG [Sporolactobacillus sp.]